MLILDKPRALDLMLAQASRAPLPEEFSLDAMSRPEPHARGGFRVAIYGPLRPPAVWEQTPRPALSRAPQRPAASTAAAGR